jgi:radical SAM superfamily enzyme YgiQ (UPF0313 family)
MFAEERLLFTPVGSEANSIPIVFAFPNEYTVGITSLGYQVVWATLAVDSRLSVARLFTDINEPLPHDIELLGFSFSWELDYVNIFKLLTRLEVPLRSCDRQDTDPIVFGGGPVLSANPEPFADFFDIVLLGDGEHLLKDFIDTYHEVRNGDRATKLRTLSRVPGLYIPSLYGVTYHEESIVRIEPIEANISETISKQTYRGNRLSASTVVTEKAAWENIFMVEVVRSCPEMCRFCLASYLTLPFRTASLEDSLIPSIEAGLQVTDRIGLLGASVTQHPQFDELLAYLGRSQFDRVRLSIASVRTNTVTEALARTLAKRDTKSLTIAIESGSERIRKIVNKKLETEDIIAACVNAKSGGLQGLKLYGMAGVPGESDEDLDKTIDLFSRLKKAAKGLRLTFGCSTFVPKAHTPFQWDGVDRAAEKRLQYLQKKLKPQGIDFRPESYNWSVIQALLSRGDRRLSYLLELTSQYGESLGSYRRAFKELRSRGNLANGSILPDLDYYVHRSIPTDTILPWHHLRTSLSPETILKHRLLSTSEEERSTGDFN